MVKRNKAAAARTEMLEVDMAERIRRFAGTPLHRSGVVLGIGDDCAICRPRGCAEDLLFTTDMLIEGAHFLPATHSPEDIGWKALARGLSDIAAMGGEPRFCLVSLALAGWADQKWLDAFYRGLLRLARREGVALIGGDLARGPHLMCDIVVCGAVARGQALLRSGARPGDGIFVSGVLGGSALGLERGSGRAWRQHLRPEPRLALGRLLRRLGATAAMDLSDGLSLDLNRLCRASGVKAEISAPPIYPGATLRQALDGGEDYELLFTAPPRVKVPSDFEGLPLTRIGIIRRGAPCVELDGAALAARGWDHFRKR
jgi:thiamine-monophosphate kinase